MAAAPKSFIPWIFVGAMALVVAVNAGMVTIALGTFPGLAHDDAFARGLAYNRVLTALERQEELGWALQMSFVPGAATDGTLRVRLNDRDGNALGGARVAATLLRPVERDTPIQIELREGEIGSYSAVLPGLRRGQWDARIHVARAGIGFATTQRMVIP